MKKRGSEKKSCSRVGALAGKRYLSLSFSKKKKKKKKKQERTKCDSWLSLRNGHYQPIHYSQCTALTKTSEPMRRSFGCTIPILEFFSIPRRNFFSLQDKIAAARCVVLAESPCAVDGRRSTSIETPIFSFCFFFFFFFFFFDASWSGQNGFLHTLRNAATCLLHKPCVCTVKTEFCSCRLHRYTQSG